MKNLFYSFYNKLIIGLILFSSVGLCQIPNAGFENWTSGIPDNWSTTNNPQFTNILQSNDAHSGSYSAEGTVASISGFSVAPVLSSEFPYSGRPINFSGYYKFTSISSDTLDIAVALFKNSNTIGGGVFHTTANANSYTQFNIPLIYVSSDTPDSAGIGIFIGPTVGAHNGSTFYIDDLSFTGGATAVNEKNTDTPNSFELKQNYPNPFNPTTIISYSIPKSTFVVLKIFNTLGEEVESLVNEEQSPGNHKVKLNGSRLSSGVYFYMLKAGSFVKTKKLILLK